MVWFKSDTQSWTLLFGVRGGVTLAHVFAIFGLAAFPGCDVYTPSLFSDSPAADDNKGFVAAQVVHFVLSAVTLALYWNLCLSDPGITASVDKRVPVSLVPSNTSSLPEHDSPRTAEGARRRPEPSEDDDDVLRRKGGANDPLANPPLTLDLAGGHGTAAAFKVHERDVEEGFGTFEVTANPVVEFEFDPERMYLGGVCKWCQKAKLLRTKHCRVCGICVRRFDHHCDWACNCVGFNNHRAFTLYITVEFIFILFAFIQACRGLAAAPGSDRLAIPIILLLLGALAILFVGLLIKMHAEFLAEDATTYETYRGFRIPTIKEPQDDNPYNVRSLWKNVVHFYTGLTSELDSLPTNWRSPF